MPFDAPIVPPQVDDDILEVLILARNLINNGWVKGVSVAGSDTLHPRYCAVGAYRVAFRMHKGRIYDSAIDNILAPILYKQMPWCYRLMDWLAGASPHDSTNLMVVNVQQKTHKAMIVRWYDKAIATRKRKER